MELELVFVDVDRGLGEVGFAELVFVDVDRGLGEVLFVDRWAVFSAVFFGDGVL